MHLNFSLLQRYWARGIVQRVVPTFICSLYIRQLLIAFDACTLAFDAINMVIILAYVDDIFLTCPSGMHGTAMSS
jgi:hypothetical protein